MDYDVLVLGSGIGGMESSIKLADMGYQVLLVEKEASVGGRMILLSKVFPTLDCASCISGPKMSTTINHPNIKTLAYSEIDHISRNTHGGFQVTVREKAKFVDWAACTGCDVCQKECTVAVPDQFNAELAPRRAAYIAFPQAVPKKAILDRSGTSPCIAACPAGIKAHGYVSLTRTGKYEEAFQLNLDATPLVGTLGRACYAPCENGCTRSQVEGTLPIRMIKRYVADEHYATHEGPGVEVSPPTGKSVAVVGSGPAGLTAAWQLARQGHRVTIHEAQASPGGYARHGIPSFRLPKDVVEADIANLTAIGVEIICNSPVADLQALKDSGYDAVVIATGAHREAALDAAGVDAAGVVSGLSYLKDSAAEVGPDLTGKRVVVVGGDVVAMNAARTALRQGATSATVVAEAGKPGALPCNEIEYTEAAAEGVEFVFSTSVAELRTAASGEVTAVRCVPFSAPSTSADASEDAEAGETVQAAAAPATASTAASELVADLVITCLGLDVDESLFVELAGVGNKSRILANRRSLQTKAKWLFAAGDVASGLSTITRAVGSGRRAAHMVDRFLKGESLDGFELDSKLSTTKHRDVLARHSSITHRDPVTGQVRLNQQPRDFAEIEAGLTEEEARSGAGSCLDCGICSECQECAKQCPAFAIDMTQRDKVSEVEVGAVVVSTGHKLFAADLKPEYGFGKFPNVITAMQMDRLLAPTRPFNTVLRPGDGKVPDRIAYISCTGSRDKTVGNPLCSKFCCMYSIKQNQLIMGALPLADVTMHYMDMRAAGKRYEEFYTQARDMGAQYIKGRVAKITEEENGDLLVRYEDIENGGGIVEASYDLVVLAVGIQPNRDVENLFTDAPLGLDEYYYVAEPSAELSPGQTNIPGVFVAGTAAGAKDIVDTILHAGAAVAQVAAHLEHQHFAEQEALV
ncbi:FAD-dependent oxidoreductase [Propionicimonas sp.]|uniref:FAD-dependent oxidoreductase n=1 Tax=Propionicimonas sp. TaxID=1955623 RepID=UPI00181C6F64|nr:FAD-dependent oxidoreductase [Propionicimonas sp.]MBU3976231.1 FAD-dependent oxidoreductase [Actinomycetota bacterium]MBA3021043.1 FAD-dependent oxidoreductase [Propionicimonas sp.]MBU3985626.1 FAD-dependent oxidoreductase [Actinomycetota bacterium]MBU4008411.1 FAD-dependent oxidoreductase [Actinomycetota bacterium]MBU4066439.1 FAD-dependent oxidoreductase [Actinomycetota bacterium]